MADQYRVVDLAGWTRGETEPGGAEEKRWFRAPEASRDDGHWLFKPRRIKDLTLSKERRALGDTPDRLIRGEDWAEKISYELARLIDVPAAHTELATVVRRGTNESVNGSISLDMRPPHWGWTSGAALLAERDNEFDSESCRGHTIQAAFEAMTDLRGPVGTAYEDWPAFDVFAGYLLLDAWVANSDRHAYNWGVLQDPTTGTVCLGPSFDHGSALSSGNGDDYRAHRVELGTVEQWCSRGRTKRFDGGRAIDLTDLAATALAMTSAKVQRYWRERLAVLDLDSCDDVISATPNLSDHTRSFLNTAVATNRKRLLDVLH